MAIKRINHHTFTVSNLDKSIPFYRDLLGFRLTQDKMREDVPSYDKVMGFTDVKVRVALFMDPADESMLALLQYHNPKPIIREMSNAYVGTSILASIADTGGGGGPSFLTRHMAYTLLFAVFLFAARATGDGDGDGDGIEN